MALTTEQIKQLDKSSPAAAKAKLGTSLAAAETGASRQGVHVANAAGATPTKAEFDALLASLRGAGLLASA